MKPQSKLFQSLKITAVVGVLPASTLRSRLKVKFIAILLLLMHVLPSMNVLARTVCELLGRHLELGCVRDFLLMAYRLFYFCLYGIQFPLFICVLAFKNLIYHMTSCLRV